MGWVRGGCAVHELQKARRWLVRLAGEGGGGGSAGGGDVGELCRVFAVEDLRGYVAGGAKSVADLREAGVTGTIGRAEVGELYLSPVVHKDILGLYVTVDNPSRMSIG